MNQVVKMIDQDLNITQIVSLPSIVFFFEKIT